MRKVDLFQLCRRHHIRSLRFLPDPSVNYSSFDVVAILKKKEGVEVITQGRGLLGYHGALPRTYVVQLQKQLKHNNKAYYDFLALFHQRHIELAFMCFERMRPYLDANVLKVGSPFFLDALLPSISPYILQKQLDRLFSLPVSVNEKKVRSFVLPQSASSCLGLGASSQLSRSFVVGRRVYCQKASILLVLGPLTKPAYLAIRPGGSMYKRFCLYIDRALPSWLQVRCQLLLKKEAVPAWILAGGSTLGVDSWLYRPGRTCDVDEPFFVVPRT